MLTSNKLVPTVRFMLKTRNKNNFKFILNCLNGIRKINLIQAIFFKVVGIEWNFATQVNVSCFKDV